MFNNFKISLCNTHQTIIKIIGIAKEGSRRTKNFRLFIIISLLLLLQMVVTF